MCPIRDLTPFVHRFRYHKDPIDTLYRHSSRELEVLFPAPDYQLIESRIISSPEKMGCGPFLIVRIFNKVLRWLIPNRQLQMTMNLDNKVAVVVVQKKESNS